MVVCKFFQQGYCRYGQSCRFEHAYASKYSYHAPSQQAQPSTQAGSVSDEQLVNQVQSDVQAALQGRQWLLSCYSPFKEKPILPGLADLSPEEARLFIYEAKANNTIDQAVSYMNNLFKDSRAKYQQLLQPSQEIKTILRSLYKGENVPSPFSNQSSGFGGSSASSLFQSAVQTSPFASPTSPSSIFGQANDPAKSLFAQATQSVFSGNQAQTPSSMFVQQQPQQSQSIFNTSPQQSNVFGPQSPGTAAKSIFAQASQSTFGPSVPQPQPQSIFASQQSFGPNQNPPFSQNQNDPFGQKPSDPFGQKPSDLFGQKSSDPFGQKLSDPFGQKNNDPFGQKPSDPFGQSSSPGSVFQSSGSSIFDQPIDESGVYSKDEEINETDMQAYKDKLFKLGFVPEVAPSKSLCM